MVLKKCVRWVKKKGSEAVMTGHYEADKLEKETVQTEGNRVYVCVCVGGWCAYMEGLALPKEIDGSHTDILIAEMVR